MIKDKIILTDVDGVLLDWEFAFHTWMEKHGHTPIKEHKQLYSIAKRFSITQEQSKRLTASFNESASIGFLPPLRDSVYYVKKLHEKHGYVFHAITSLSTDPYAGKLRERNLAKLYGGIQINYREMRDSSNAIANHGDKDVSIGLKTAAAGISELQTQRYFEQWATKNGFCMDTIKTLTGLIFLSMCPIHEQPFSDYLFYKAKEMLSDR